MESSKGERKKRNNPPQRVRLRIKKTKEKIRQFWTQVKSDMEKAPLPLEINTISPPIYVSVPKYPPLPKENPPLPKENPPLPKENPSLPKENPPLPKENRPLPKENPPWIDLITKNKPIKEIQFINEVRLEDIPLPPEPLRTCTNCTNNYLNKNCFSCISENNKLKKLPPQPPVECMIKFNNKKSEPDNSQIPVKTKNLDVECQVHNENLEPHNAYIPETIETLDVECQFHNKCLEPGNSQISVKTETLDFGRQVLNQTLGAQKFPQIEVKTEMVDMVYQVDNKSVKSNNCSQIQANTEVPDYECQGECQVHNESVDPDNSQISVKVEMLDVECQVHNEPDNAYIPVTTETPEVECQFHNKNLEPGNSQISVKTEMLDFERQVHNQTLESVKSSQIQVKTEMVDMEYQVDNKSVKASNSSQIQVKTDNESLEPDNTDIPVKVEMLDVEGQIHNENLESSSVKAADTHKMDRGIEISQVKSEVKDVESQVHNGNLLGSESTPDEEPRKPESSTQRRVQTKTSDITVQKNENVQERPKPSLDELNPLFQKHLMEVHEKYAMELEEMKEIMKSAFENQVAVMRKAASANLEQKLEKQRQGHAHELKKYNRQVSELSSQLRDVREKLIIERRKNDDLQQKLKSSTLKFEIPELHNVQRESEILHEPAPSPLPRKEKEKENILPPQDTSVHKMQNVRSFKIMGNAIKTEVEKGELFDTSYLADMQQQRSSNSSICTAEPDIDSVLVSKAKIKTGQPEEVFNDRLSRSLPNGKKMKRSNSTRTTGDSEMPRKRRRSSNICLTVDP